MDDNSPNKVLRMFTRIVLIALATPNHNNFSKSSRERGSFYFQFTLQLAVNVKAVSALILMMFSACDLSTYLIKDLS